MAELAVETKDLTRVFKKKPKRMERFRGRKEKEYHVTALEDVNIKIKCGELFGVLGPNGAGKTTLIKILCTLLLPTSGDAYVCGHNVDSEAEKVREYISMVSGGETSGYGILTVRENLWLFSQLYGVPTKPALKKIDAMLDEFGLAERANLKMNRVSTGERQKTNIIRGFISDPQVIFLDEPTLGLDVIAARAIRKFVRRWVAEDRTRTILLTTHYMLEADELCDRVAIIDKGRVIACDAPEKLKMQVKKENTLQLDVTGGAPDTGKLGCLKGVKSLVKEDKPETQSVLLKFMIDEESVVSDIVSCLTESRLRINSLKKSEVTLEDVFVQLTGRALSSEEDGKGRQPESETEG